MKTNQHSAKRTTRGFTLIEVMVVVTILGILAAITYFSVNAMRERARYARFTEEVNNIKVALELYRQDHNGKYPPSSPGRGVMPHASPEIESTSLAPYLPGYVQGDYLSNWPKGPWPGSLYSFENLEDIDHVTIDVNGDGNLTGWDSDGVGSNNVVQITLRFCQAGNPSSCRFPGLWWADGWNNRDGKQNAAVYFCLRNRCRPHLDYRIDNPTSTMPPGYCINSFSDSPYCDGQPH